MKTNRKNAKLWSRVAEQAKDNPAIFGRIDFDRLPERFTTEFDEENVAGFEDLAREVLADEDLVDLMAAYTFTGDKVADAYAALMPRYGLRTLIDMLQQACDQGVHSVVDAPEELRAFIHAMEARPDWVDMDLVNEGARIERNHYAHVVPYAIRGAFLATFLNKYSALPMALTGNLSDKLAAKRVFETATFFTLTVMPGALERYGEAFKAAAMVRLMHSMVRFNVMAREGLWDTEVFGVPIPQVDQMPAGQISSFLLAFQAIREGRDFTEGQRARIEIARYRCFLLGLPEELLGTTPQEIARLMIARQATLRRAYDEKICGDLVRGTMLTELSNDASLKGRVTRRLERSFSRAFFIKWFLRGDESIAREIGVDYTAEDKGFAALAGLMIFSKMRTYGALIDVPLLGQALDKRLIGKLRKQLKAYGHAEFVSDGASYRGAKEAAE